MNQAPSKIPLLFLIMLTLLGGAFLLFQRDDLKSRKRALEAVEKRIAAAERLAAPTGEGPDSAAWEEFLRREEPRFYCPAGEEEIYRLGRELSASIRRQGLRIAFYNLLEKEGRRYFNYTLEGSAAACFGLIRSLSRRETYFDIDTLGIERNGEECTMTILFAPAVLSPASEEPSAAPLPDRIPPPSRQRGGTVSPGRMAARLFYQAPEAGPEEAASPEESPRPAEPRINRAPSWLSYVGQGLEGGRRHYYFLDTRTNRTIEIVPGGPDNAFEIEEQTDSRFQIILAGETYYVSKY